MSFILLKKLIKQAQQFKHRVVSVLKCNSEIQTQIALFRYFTKANSKMQFKILYKVSNMITFIYFTLNIM